jgi:hypothetical protein
MTSEEFAVLVPPIQTNVRDQKIFHCPYDLCAAMRDFSAIRNLVGGAMAAPSWLNENAVGHAAYRL